MADEKIEVRYSGIPGFETTTGYSAYHKYIVYTDSNGKEWYARGGPGTTAGDFGELVTEYGEYGPGTIDWALPGIDNIEVIKEGPDLSSYWASIKQTMDNIDAADYWYGPTTQNSNATVDKALADAGLNPAELDDVGENFSPGSDSSLFYIKDVAASFAISPLLSVWLGVFDDGKNKSSPLIIDLDGDGVEATQFVAGTTATFFDIDNDGFAEQTAWAGAHDGLLARDINANGLIDNASELFGSATVDGFAHLALHDSNGDLIINLNDPVYAELLLWQDADGDAITDPGELQSLAFHNIESIDLAGVNSSTQTVNGNPVSHTSTVKFTNDTTAAIADVWFVHDHMNTTYTQNVTLVEATHFLPTLRGYGNLKHLHAEMSLNATLLTKVKDFTLGWSFAEFTDEPATNTTVIDILYRWAGVEAVSSTSRGPHIDARQLEFLEELFGEEWTQKNKFPDPGVDAADTLRKSWDGVLATLKAQLVFQAGGSALFGNSTMYDYNSGEFEGTKALDQNAINALVAEATAPGVSAEDYWTNVGAFLNTVKPFANITAQENTWMDTAIQASDPTLSWTDIKARVENTATSFDDEIHGDANANTIDGGLGDDTIWGYGGNDSLYGSEGDDFLHGSDGDDDLHGGAGNDTLEGSNDNDTLYGNAGNDLLRGGNGNDTLSGGLGGDTVEGGGGDDTFIFVGGDDYYRDGSGTENVKLPPGITLNDLSFFRLGTHNLYIQVGLHDTIELENQINSSSANFFETLTFADTSTFDLSTLGAVTTYGTDAAETIYGITSGASSNDTIYGYGGDDVIYAGVGTDTIDGGAGNDHIVTDGGDDTIIASAGFDKIDPNNGFETYVVPQAYSASDVTLYRVKGLTGNDNDLLIQIAGFNQAQVVNHFWGTTQALDQITFENGDPAINLLTYSYLTYGTSGNDNLSYAATSLQNNDSTYVFGEGTDRVSESAGTDTVLFAAGYSLANISVQHFQGKVSGVNGKHLVIKNAEGDSLTFQKHFNDSWHELENLKFNDGTTVAITSLEIESHGTEGNDRIDGLDSGDLSPADVIYGYGGNDQLYGRDGDDIVYGGDGDDYISDGAGNDTLYGEAGADQIYGKQGNDTLYGGTGNDTLHGDDTFASSSITGNDTIYGEDGADTLRGGRGDDTLYGGDGLDTLYGDHGADTFVFEAASAFNNIDVIKDFSTGQNDAIDIAGLLIGYDPLTDAIADFVAFTDNAGNSDMSVDRDGTGGAHSAVQIATLENITGLDATTLETNNNLITA